MNKIAKALDVPVEDIFYKEGIKVRDNSNVNSEVSAISNITTHDEGIGDEKQTGNI